MRQREAYKLIVGLGNPGKEYENTRHNAGFMVIDRLEQLLPGSFETGNSYSSVFMKGRCKGSTLFLQKPQTYMNLSGKAISKLIQHNKIKPQEILVVFDDLDLPFGKIRIKKGGGSGGHNGIKSMIEELGTPAFARLKVGIGKMDGKHQADHVLSEFDNDEKKMLPEMLETSAKAAQLILYRGTAKAMNEYNNFELNKDNQELNINGG